ncbi:MAG: DUF1572 family protein [Chitinophagaceae bacterium]|nr:DUF1572 family protein [Chitinophagaceae bacterium]
MPAIEKIFLESAVKRLSYYKELGDKTLGALSEQELHFTPNEESNSIAVIIQHLSGNMLSRWTDFLTSDGEKEWRNRDTEFEIGNASKEQLVGLWEKGWACCLGAICNLTGDDLGKTIYIRSEGLVVTDAINRQLAHYPYHVGQIIYIAKMIKNNNWQSLSIPRKGSDEYNRQMTGGK